MIFLALGSNLSSSFGDRFVNINLTKYGPDILGIDDDEKRFFIY